MLLSSYTFFNLSRLWHPFNVMWIVFFYPFVFMPSSIYIVFLFLLLSPFYSKKLFILLLVLLSGDILVSRRFNCFFLPFSHTTCFSIPLSPSLISVVFVPFYLTSPFILIPLLSSLLFLSH